MDDVGNAMEGGRLGEALDEHPDEYPDDYLELADWAMNQVRIPAATETELDALAYIYRGIPTDNKTLRDHPIFDQLRLKRPDFVSEQGGSRTRGNLPVYEVVSAAAAGASLLPFLQSLAQRAGSRAFDAVKSRFRQVAQEGTDAADNYVLAVEDCSGQVSFQVPDGLPDAALEALESLDGTDLEDLGRPAPLGGCVALVWDEDTSRWRRTMR